MVRYLDISLNTLFLSGTRGHIYIKLASDMDAATATAVESIVTKAINENEGGSDAAEQVHIFLYPNKWLFHGYTG